MSGVSQSAAQSVSQFSNEGNPAGTVPTAPLRVIHVGECLVQAGIEQWLKSLIRFADPQRMRILRCIATSNQVDPAVAADMGAPVEMGQDRSVQRAAEECDVLLASGPAELGPWLTRMRPKMCVFVAHGDSIWTRRILTGCGSLVDHVVAVSGKAQAVCSDFPTTVIANGVDTAHVASSRSREDVRRQCGFLESDFVLGFVGRFSPEKRPEAVIEAVAGLPSQYKALLVGWGPMRESLMELANRRIPGRYAFAAARDHLGDYYQAMDCFCLPSLTEGFGLVVLEAMLCGCPVVATPVGCVPDFVEDRVSGVLVSGDPDSLRQAADLIRRHPQWAGSMAEEGRRGAERQGHALRMTRQYEALLTGLWQQKYGQRTPAVAL